MVDSREVAKRGPANTRNPMHRGTIFSALWLSMVRTNTRRPSKILIS